MASHCTASEVVVSTYRVQVLGSLLMLFHRIMKDINYLITKYGRDPTTD